MAKKAAESSPLAIRRISGSGAGGMVAGLYASGLSPEEILEAVQALFADGRAFDRNHSALKLPLAWGLNGWNEVAIELANRVRAGRGHRVSDWGVWVHSLAEGMPRMIRHREHPHVCVPGLLAAASAPPWIAEPQEVAGLKGLFWGEGFGGIRMDVWDDDPFTETIGARILAPVAQVRPVRSLGDAVRATVRAAYAAGSRGHVPRRFRQSLTTIRTSISPLEFRPDRDEVAGCFEAGRAAGMLWVAELGDGQPEPGDLEGPVPGGGGQV